VAKFKKTVDDMDKAYKILEDSEKKQNRNRNDLLTFFAGLLMFAGGVFMILQNIIVRTSWGTSFYRIGTWAVPNGLIMLPVLIGIVMLFVMDKKIFGEIEGVTEAVAKEALCLAAAKLSIRTRFVARHVI